MGNKFDFSGWATRNDMKCSDGRIIRKDAFKHNDGETVPLVWNHKHNDPNEVLGHALLENRDEGVYAYCTFNDTESGKTAKLLVQHGDIDQLSIYANKLKQQGCNVIHGAIREVSLVLAGANPGAYIESIMMHGEESDEEGIIYTGEFLENIDSVFHAENNEEGDTELDTTETKEIFTEEQMSVVHSMIKEALENAENPEEQEIEHAEESENSEIEHAEKESDEKTVQDVIDSMTEEQRTVMYALVGEALKGKGKEETDVKHSDEFENEDNLGGNADMKTNVFDQGTTQNEVLSHSEMKEIFEDAKRCGSLRDAVLAHGIEDIELLFPDAKSLNREPEFIKRDDDWVAKVLGGVHHTPFSRIKSIFADITAEEARAKGYQKGKQKLEEVFKLLKRVTNPTTVYKKQKLDRDDLLDITDFNVIPWMKAELRMMLNEEIARAILVGDGRTELAEDKINEENIRPIWKMEDLFTVKVPVEVAAGATADDRARAFIKACIKSRKMYKGSGNPSMFMPEDMLTDCLLIEDKNGRIIYDTVARLAATLRVKEIIPVPVMEGLTRTDSDDNKFELAAIYVNLYDYNVGTDKGGEINMFDDFDIDYNQYKYLMETRCSGTLTKPYSAVVLEFASAVSEG